MTRLAADLANWLAARTAEFLCCAALVAGLAYGVVARLEQCSGCQVEQAQFGSMEATR